MPGRAKNRATPLGFMMNGPMPPDGFSSALKSGTSAPPQALPFHSINLRFGLYGLPAGSQEARLYSTRRFAGQAQAQLSVWPMPVGSELSRRAIKLPAGPHAPQKIQQPDCVLPSSRSSAKPASCSPALRVILVGSLGSARSFRALPEYSLASSSGLGLSTCAYFHVKLRIGSGKAPPSVVYMARMRVKMPAMMSKSLRASPGGLAPFQCHCSQRAELTRAPFSSAKHGVVRRNTSV